MYEKLIETLTKRFMDNSKRHQGLDWDSIAGRLQKNAAALLILEAMEATGGEPDVIAYENASNSFVFCDCSAESPSGRRSLCYDDHALELRKANKPAGSAESMAQKLGVSFLTEEEYRYLQTLGEFDLKTSSWILTPLEIRNLGGALFCDRRYNRVFTYHNGADSYYSSRGFRAILKVR